MEYEMLYENQHEFINPIAATDNTHGNPLANNSQEHGNWDTTTMTIQAVTLQQFSITEGTTYYPGNESPIAPLKTKEDQPERPQTMTHYRNRASHHQPTTSAEAERGRTASPNQGKLPQPDQQEQNENNYSNCGSRQQARVEIENEDKARRHPEALTLHNPRDDPPELEPNTKGSQFGIIRNDYIQPSHSGTSNYARPINIPKSPFGLEENHYELRSLSGTEEVNIYTNQQQHQSV